MKKTVIASILFLGATLAGFSADTIYTSQSAFIAALSPGYYSENFASFAGYSTPASISLSGGSPTFSLDVTAPASGLFINVDGGGLHAVGNFAVSDAVVLSYTSGNVYAAGAEYYLTDINGVPQNGNTTVTYNDGTIGMVPSSSAVSQSPYAFYGVISTSPITSMNVIDNGTAHFVNIANLYVGTPVPEPATGALLLTGVVGLALARRRK